jgi:hypothetical protein
VAIASSYKTEDPGFESRKGVRFLGLPTLQCCRPNLICIVIVCSWRKKNFEKNFEKNVEEFFVGEFGRHLQVSNRLSFHSERLFLFFSSFFYSFISLPPTFFPKRKNNINENKISFQATFGENGETNQSEKKTSFFL